MKKSSTYKIVVIANLAALSTLLYFFVKFPLPFIFPAFLDIQFSNLPAILGGFMFGPVAGSAVVVIRQIIKLPFSSTAGVGELADLLIGLSTVITSSLIYRKFHSKKGAIYASVVGMFTWIIMAIITNYFILVPFFIEFLLGGDLNTFVGMLSVIPGVNESNYMTRYLLYTVIPFNILLSGIVYLLTFLVYKRLKHFIDDIYEKVTDQK